MCKLIGECSIALIRSWRAAETDSELYPTLEQEVMGIYFPVLWWWTSTGYGWSQCSRDPHFSLAFRQIEAHLLMMDFLSSYVLNTHQLIPPHSCMLPYFPPVVYIEPTFRRGR